MSRITKRICKALSVLLSLTLLLQFLYLQGLPTLADAAETPSSTTASTGTDLSVDETVELLGEDVSRREENVKHFFLSNHTSRAIVYAEPVHYEVDGEWVEIDNTLTSEAAADGEDFNGFVNLANAFQIKFANNTNSSKLVRLRKDNYEISWGYDGNAVSGNVKSKSKKQVTTPDEALAVPTENALGQIDYPYVEDNTSLQYIVSGSGVKENIVVHAAADAYTYSFDMKVKNVTLSLQEDGSVVATATDTGETVFRIPAPFMTDANHRYSDAVSYSLTQKGNKKYTLTVTADADWINSEETAFPVVIDPIITTELTKTDVNSTFISEDSEYSETALAYGYSLRSVGYDSYQFGLTRTLVQFNLPTLNRGDMVIEAELGMRMWHSSFSSDVDTQINAHIITEAWDVTDTTWNNAPDFDSVISDYSFITSLASDEVEWKMFDITRAVKEWYAGSLSNNGILIKANTEAPGAVCWFSSEYYTESEDIPDKYPRIVIDYRNNKGLEDYWTYTGLDVGSAGTAYINDYSGNLVFAAPLLTSPSERMSLELLAVYNGYIAHISPSVGKNSSHLTSIGAGWRLNVQQTLLPASQYGLTDESLAEYPYVYTDGDGTDHYFEAFNLGEETLYCDEDGLGLELTVNSDSTYTITDLQDNTLTFNSAGNLTAIKDASGNSIQIVYLTGDKRIDYILDGTNHKYTFTYSGLLVTSILDSYNRGVRFTYASTHLMKITYTDGITSTFAYMGDHALAMAQDHDGYRVTFEYTTLATGKQVSEVQEYSAPDENGDRTAGQRITFDRTYYNQTVIRTAGPDSVFGNNDDLCSYCQFDDFGRLTSSQVRNANGGNTGAAVTRYTEATSIKQLNCVESSAALGKNVTNWATNGNAESGMTGWTAKLFDSTATVAASTAQAYFGKRSIAINNTSINASAGRTDFRQDITGLSPNYKYTFSAYVKLVDVAEPVFSGDSLTGAYISVATQESETSLTARATPVTDTDSNINDGWHRLSVTITLPADCTELRVYLCLRNMIGTAYFDGIQLERNASTHPFNLLENASFERSSSGMPTDWTGTNISFSTSGSTVTQGITTATKKEVASSLMIQGDALQDKYISQVIPVAGNPDDTYIISGWAKANAVSDTQHGNTRFEISVYVTYQATDGSSYIEEKPAAYFNSTLPLDNSYQYTAQAFSLRSYDHPEYVPLSIVIQPRYAYQANTAYFDFLQLIREPVPTYTYDENGNLISSVDNAEQKSEMSYDGSDMTGSVDVAGYAYDYQYDNYHNLTLATSASGNKTRFYYNVYGQNTGSLFGNSDESMGIASEIVYNSASSTLAAGANIAATKDADGYQTSYYYDAYGRLVNIRDPKNVSTTHTYVSALSDRVATTSSAGTTVSYTYDGTRLQTLTFGDDTFSFETDLFGNAVSTSLNGLSLSTNTYGVNNGLLQQTTYANGDVETYGYNWLGQLLAVGNGTDTQYSWLYDDNGTLLSFSDLVAGRQFAYTNDSLGRLVRQLITAGGTALGGLEYDYDIRDNVTRFVLNMGDYEVTQQYLYSAIDGQAETEAYAKDNLPIRYLISDTRYADYDYDSLNRLTQRSFSTTRPLLNNYSYYASTRNTDDSTYYQTTKLHTEIVDNVAYRYTYDALGNIIKIEKGERVTGTNTADNFTEYFSYEYDALGQLTRVNSVPENAVILYEYDVLGNILSESVYNGYATYGSMTTADIVDNDHTPNYRTVYHYGALVEGFSKVLTGRTVYTFDVSDGSYTTVDSSVSYDEIGNPLTYESATLTWQNGRQLASYSKDGTSVSYTYDSDSLRTSKTVNGVKHEYLYVGGQLAYEKRGDAHLYYYYDSNGLFTALRYIADGENDIYYAVTNVQGDVLGLYDDAGVQLVSYVYDAWGDVASLTDSSGFNLGTLNPIRYRGYYYDEETGLYYVSSRYYDPEIGRWINADVMFDTETVLGFNLFAYCGNNPIMYLDPTGYGRTYVIYYNNPGSGFYDQAMNSPYYNRKSKNVYMISVTSNQDFIDAWNSMSGTIDYVYLYLHGDKGVLYFNREDLRFSGKQSFSSLNSKKVKKGVYLFSCKGGAGSEGNNVAWMFAKLTRSKVYACTGGVSYSKIFGKYYARKAWDWGIIKTFYYQKRYIFWGANIAKSAAGQW